MYVDDVCNVDARARSTICSCDLADHRVILLRKVLIFLTGSYEVTAAFVSDVHRVDARGASRYHYIIIPDLVETLTKCCAVLISTSPADD